MSTDGDMRVASFHWWICKVCVCCGEGASMKASWWVWLYHDSPSGLCGRCGGHARRTSPGTVSMLIPVREGRRRDVLSLLGGTAFPRTLEGGDGLMGGLGTTSTVRWRGCPRSAGGPGRWGRSTPTSSSTARTASWRRSRRKRAGPILSSWGAPRSPDTTPCSAPAWARRSCDRPMRTRVRQCRRSPRASRSRPRSGQSRAEASGWRLVEPRDKPPRPYLRWATVRPGMDDVSPAQRAKNRSSCAPKSSSRHSVSQTADMWICVRISSLSNTRGS